MHQPWGSGRAGARVGGVWLSIVVAAVACGQDPGPPAGDSTGASETSGESDATGSSSTAATTGGADTSSDPGESSGGSSSSGGDTGHGDGADDELPYDPEQLAKVCARGNADPIAVRLCATPSPAIASLADLYDALEIVIEPASFALLANSTSLAARSVSALNPRVFLRLPPGPGISVELAAAAFSRGEQVVELVGYDESAGVLNFYLLSFGQACNDTPQGCGVADRFTDAIERDWSRWSLYQDIDLVNRPLDCLVCHQPDGPEGPRLLLMQQAEDPWLHWFPGISIASGSDTASATSLLPLFLEMHGQEDSYGGIPIAAVTPPNPTASGIVMAQMLEIYLSITGGPAPGLTPMGQEHAFDSATIEAELAVGSTATWDGYYAQTLTGARLPVPYHHHDVTDPTLREGAVASYQALLAGEPETDEMIDPREVFAEATEVALGFRPRPQADAEEILHAVCQRCHNERLDQTLSRARFDASEPAALTPEQKAAAIDRLMREPGEPGAMPPRRFATLPEAARQQLVEYLQQ
ncbi:MAG: c-type cytochrome [Nannocystaceae bacterium]